MKDYYENLPGKRMAAGCLIRDEGGSLLLVKPSYKATWEIPGGFVENNESPRECCKREISEELGLTISLGRLLLLDYNEESDDKTESLMFIFDGGQLSKKQIDKIRLAKTEINMYALFQKHAMPDELTDSLRARIFLAWEQLSNPTNPYTENQLRKP